MKIYRLTGCREALGNRRAVVSISQVSLCTGLSLFRFGTTNFFIVLLVLILVLFTGCCRTIQVAPLEAGVSMIEITPPVGFPQEQEKSIGVKSPLYAKALVFRQGNVQGALLMCDLAIIPRDLSRLVRDHSSKQTGIPYRCISVAATHIHTGPHHDTLVKAIRVQRS